VRKLQGGDEGSLTGKAKAEHANKGKQGIHSLPPINRQVFNHLQESRASLPVTVIWENTRHKSKCPLSLPTPSFYC